MFFETFQTKFEPNQIKIENKQLYSKFVNYNQNYNIKFYCMKILLQQIFLIISPKVKRSFKHPISINLQTVFKLHPWPQNFDHYQNIEIVTLFYVDMNSF